MNELVQVLQSPATLATVEVLRHVGSSPIDPATILQNMGNGIEAKVGTGLAGAFPSSSALSDWGNRSSRPNAHIACGACFTAPIRNDSHDG